MQIPTVHEYCVAGFPNFDYWTSMMCVLAYSRQIDRMAEAFSVARKHGDILASVFLLAQNILWNVCVQWVFQNWIQMCYTLVIIDAVPYSIA